jgi:hypothetical protein
VVELGDDKDWRREKRRWTLEADGIAGAAKPDRKYIAYTTNYSIFTRHSRV